MRSIEIHQGESIITYLCNSVQSTFLLEEMADVL